MTTPSDSFIQRRRTSPHAKWALNEVAALRGELKKVLTRISDLRQREDRLRTKIAALETVLSQLSVPVGVEAPLAVNAHTRYGARGQLTEMLIAALVHYGPAGATTPTLSNLVADRFNLQLADWKDRKDLLRNVTRRLKHMEASGRAEQFFEGETYQVGQPKRWRLSRTAPTLNELRTVAENVDSCPESEGV